MSLPLSHIAFLKGISEMDFRNNNTSFEVLSIGFYELVQNRVVNFVEVDSDFIVSQNKTTNNKFYTLLLRPLGKGELTLKKYVVRIGIYGYYLSNVFSKNSIKKILLNELKRMKILSIKNFIFFKN